MQQPAIRSHIGPGFEGQDISRNHILHSYFFQVTGSDDVGGGAHQIFQTLDSGLGVAFGFIGNDGIGHHHPHNQTSIEDAARYQGKTGRCP